jgi:hypothetical protein
LDPIIVAVGKAVGVGEAGMLVLVGSTIVSVGGAGGNVGVGVGVGVGKVTNSQAEEAASSRNVIEAIKPVAR